MNWNDDKLLEGRIARDTGAFGGPGLHLARVLAAHGAKVPVEGGHPVSTL